jgi:hypothetical protein
MILLFASLAAMAGYGDVDAEGYPSWAERDLHLWTNASRVDPEAFEEFYNQAGCSFDDFEPSEQSPKDLLYFEWDLNVASRFHCDDMYTNDWFAHESSDGTSFFDRVSRFYSESGYVGENIAYGYPDPFTAQMGGWMCSSGHRANIMLADYNELGTGVVSNYYTQDFAAGTVDSTNPVAMGVHEPQTATDEATFFADWMDAAAPASFEVVVDGVGYPLALTYGTDTLGVYSGEAAPDAAECHRYFFRWETAAGASATFPETGSYLYGEACEAPVDWEEGQAAEGPGGGGDGAGDGGLSEVAGEDGLIDPADIKLVGCASLGRSAEGLGALLGLGLLLGRRRRRA